jgi:molybdopterin-synthase adenylyltransferase
MSTLARQRIITGWQQDAIGQAKALVYGRDWAGSFLVWALSSLGVLELEWLGAAVPHTDAFAEFLVNDHAPSQGVSLSVYPYEPECPDDFEWILAGQSLSIIFSCSDGVGRGLLAAAASTRRISFLNVHCSVGETVNGETHPIPAMMGAALATDEFRQMINPLPGLSDRELGAANVTSVENARAGRVLVAGVGGIGVYVAALLASCGVPLVLIDGDVVELTNLNRQGLFTAADAATRRPKAEAAADRLRHLFPGSQVDTKTLWLDENAVGFIRGLAPAAIVSAVDNAATRLLLSWLGTVLGTPVVQAGTDVFSADCFVQHPGGPTLDEQMRGALRRAASAESVRRSGGCAANPSYVVPGMLAGALVAARVLAVMGGSRALPSLHWRSGTLPSERREICDEFALTSE